MSINRNICVYGIPDNKNSMTEFKNMRAQPASAPSPLPKIFGVHTVKKRGAPTLHIPAG